MVDTAVDVRFLLFCLKSVTTISSSGTFLFADESGLIPVAPLRVRVAINKAFNIRK